MDNELNHAVVGIDTACRLGHSRLDSILAARRVGFGCVHASAVDHGYRMGQRSADPHQVDLHQTMVRPFANAIAYRRKDFLTQPPSPKPDDAERSPALSLDSVRFFRWHYSSQSRLRRRRARSCLP